MIKILSIIIFVLSLWLIGPGSVSANLVIRLGQPSSPTRTSKVELSYTALNTTSATIQISCQVKTTSQASFSTFSSTSLKAGGDSGVCAYEFAQSGKYQFQVVAATNAQTQTSNQVSVEYTTTNPDRVENYRKSQPSSCQYRIEFETPSDSRIKQIEIFRSNTKEIDSTKSTKVYTQSVSVNQSISYTDTVSECNQNYYYAVRTLDSAGNSSGFVGDQEIVDTSPASVTTSPIPSATPTSVSPANPPVSPAPANPEEIESEVDVPATTPEPTGTVLGDVDEPIPSPTPVATTQNNTLPARLFWLIGLVLLFAGVTTGVIIYLKKWRYFPWPQNFYPRNQWWFLSLLAFFGQE